jgi:hypothetical protein
VNLGADVAVEGDVGIGLGVVDAEDAVDPGLDAGAFGADGVFVPAEGVDDFVEGGLLLRGGGPDDFVAAVFVVDFAEPACAAVDLVAGHGGAVADGADLDAGVDEACFGIARALDFEFELEVLEAALGGDEEVFRDLVGGGAAGDDTVFDAPDSGVEVPTGQGFAVKKGEGLCLAGSGE